MTAPEDEARAHESPPPPKSDWSETVAYSEGAGIQFAYRPHQVIVRGELARARVIALVRELLDTPDLELVHDEYDRNTRFVLPAEVDILDFIEDLRAEGIRAEPNYILFAHNLDANPLFGNPLFGNPLFGNPLFGNPLFGNPLFGNPLFGNPLFGNPLFGNPLFGNPLFGNPLFGNPLFGNPQYRATGRRRSSAQPAERPHVVQFQAAGAKVFVFDTGLAGVDYLGVSQLPELLNHLVLSTSDDSDVPDVDEDRQLDPAAGHGTFIAGVVELLAPGCDLAVLKVLTPLGDGDAWEIGKRLDALLDQFDERTILNLSFGGYAPEEMHQLRRTLRRVQRKGAVIVASAGNDATWAPLYPACLPGVVSVGALGPYGPAWFTNYGWWVRACAPGSDVVSCFFRLFDGSLPPAAGGDPDHFTGWARWSGTSFAAPAVVAALARDMALTGGTARQAVARIIDDPGLFRIPGLGTVVNTA
ncbi:MAG: S8 family serine peptidase [Tepidiformaceae bacterium]